jgi:Tol biopolymer transport system component
MPLQVPGATIEAVDVAPDGRTVAIAGRWPDGRTSSWLYRLADGGLEELSNLDPNAQLVGWSRDGTELAFHSSRGLVALRVADRLLRPLAPASKLAALPVTWGDGEFLIGGDASGLRAYATGTGAIRQLTTGMALRPRFLPDGKRFLYTSKQNPDMPGNPDGLYLASLDEPANRRRILAKRSSGFAANEHLLFVEDGTLFAQPFDPSRAELSGSATPVMDGVRYFHPNGGADFRVGGGTIAYRTPSPDDSPVWVDRRGAVTGKLGEPGLYREARLSPDGTRVVYARDDRRHSTGDLWLQDLARHATIRVTNDEWSEASVLWSLDGRRIAFRTDRDGPPDVYEQDTGAGTPPRKLYGTPAVETAIGWLPGDRLLVQSDAKLVVVRSDGSIDETVKDLPPSGGRMSVSPDGRWLARTRREGGVSEVYVQGLTRPGLRVTLARGAGAKPVWSRDGRWLYFTSDRQLMQSGVRPGDMFSHDPPTVLFTLDREILDFDVSPDGQRFLVTRAPAADFTPFRLLVNWRAKLSANLRDRP